MTDRFKTVYSKGDNFVIDNNDNKIGINKASPEESLDVSGNIKFSGEIIGNINYNNLTNKPTKVSEFTNDSNFTTETYVNTAIANLVNDAPEHLDTLRELADVIKDTSNNKIVALTSSIANITTQLGSKQDALTAGNNITIAQDGTISAQAGTTINSLNDIDNVNVGTKSVGQVLKWSGTEWTAQDDNVGSGGNGGSVGGGGNGNGVSLVPSTAKTSDLSANRPFPNNHTGTGKEGDIIYDVSKNKFYEASNSKEDGQAGGEVKFRELGYSFFSEHMEGQPPAPSFFFFSITPSSIKINWTNPIQYHSGVSNSNDPHNNTNNGEFSSTVNSNSNIYFPVVNRIMIQIYNKQTQSYETWGNKRSPVTSNTATSGGVDGLKNGYVLCSKNYPIPPMGSVVSPYFGTRNSIGRTTKVYELENFADSIILYKKDNTPENSTIQPTIQNNKLASSIKEESNVKELNTSTSGYEIKLWLENQYDSGNMTENDFNVVVLTQDNDGNDINFQTVDPPTEPISLQSKIAFNDLGIVSNGKTYIELAVKDPKNTSQSSSGDFNNINLTRIKIQYANVGDVSTITESSWNNVSKIYWNNSTSYTSNSNLFQSKLLSSSNFSNGIHVIDRVNDHGSINDDDTTTIRYYYIKIDETFLSTITNYNVNSKFKFRVSYKNASNDNFGQFKQSNVISINRPNKPTISQVKMTSYNTFTITLASFNDREDIIGDTTNISNNNMGVFLRNINFNVAYQYSGQSSQSNITTFTEIEGGENSTTKSTNTSVYINTTNFGQSTYTYTLPAGFYPNDSNTNPITYYFTASVQNNLIDGYSEVSDQQPIQITKPNSSMTITLTPQISGSNYNNKILATFTAPSNGNRGVESTKTESGLPKLQKYTFQSTNLKNVNVNPDTDVKHDNTSNTSDRDADPSTQRMFTFYDSLKASTGTGLVTKNLDLAVREYNEYVNDHTEETTNMSATATKPEQVTINNHSNLVISNTTSKNTVKLNWSHPTNRGLSIGGNNIRNTILTYRINIERDSTTNKYIDNNSDHSDTTYETTTTQSDTSNDKTGTTDATNTKTLTSSNDGSLLWPNSTYNYTVRATNSLGYESAAQTTKGTFTTGTPELPSGFEYFTSSKLDNLRNTYDLENNNNYHNLGVLVSAGVTSSTTYSGTAVQITNYNNLSNITSNTVTHVLNKKHLQNFNNTLSNSVVQSWSSSVPTTANQAGFKIVNAASSDAVLYTIGMSSNYITETKDDTVFQIIRTDRKDIYSETYDDRNRGYWLKETIQYKINLATKGNLEAYLYKPLKLELKSYYNTNGSDTSISTNQTGETVILQNSYSTNPNNYVYLDILDSNPSIGKNSTNNMITYTPSNQINGIPNLARGGTIVLKYKLENYSQYYLLKSSINVAEHYFSYATSKANSVINWTSKSGGTRYSNYWIVDKTLSSISSTNTATSGITIKIRARNTKGTSDLIIGSSHSAVYNFIYDKPSVDLINQSGINIMEVPSSFNPDFNQTYAKTALTGTMSNFSSTGNSTNNNQLNLWNGYFYSRNGWQNATSITTQNCANYGMSNTLPVFNGQDSDFKYVIFKYTRIMPDGNANRIICALKGSSSSNDPEVNISDLLNDNVSVFLYTGTAMSGHYWLNISKGNTALTLTDAYNQAITYVGNLGDGIYTSGSKGINNSTFINSSGLSNTFTNSSALGGSMPRRVIGAYINRLDFSAGNILTFYIAIKIKNNINKKVEKPDLWLSGENTSSKTYKFS